LAHLDPLVEVPWARKDDFVVQVVGVPSDVVGVRFVNVHHVLALPASGQLARSTNGSTGI
jgi:hypothetical protein